VDKLIEFLPGLVDIPLAVPKDSEGTISTGTTTRRDDDVTYIYGHMPSVLAGYPDHTRFPIIHRLGHCEKGEMHRSQLKEWTREQMKINKE
jgi:hypothetical protein